MGERASSGELRGLQILLSGANPVRGGFDSHTFPPVTALVLTLCLIACAVSGTRGATADVQWPWRADSLRATATDQGAGIPLRAARIGDSGPRDAASVAGPEAPAKEPFRPSPGGAFWRSTALPAWGQLYNRRYVRAILFIAGRAYLGYRIFEEGGEANDLETQAKSLPDGAEKNATWRARNRALDRRDDFIWWSGLAWLFTMTEAYVDAALMDFDDQFDDERIVPKPEPVVRLGLRLTFQ